MIHVKLGHPISTNKNFKPMYAIRGNCQISKLENNSIQSQCPQTESKERYKYNIKHSRLLIVIN